MENNNEIKDENVTLNEEPAVIPAAEETAAPEPVVEAPVETPVEAAPAQPAPVEPAPVEPAPVAPVEPELPGEAVVEIVEPAAPAEEPKKKGKAGLIIFVILLLAAAGFALWFFVLGGNGANAKKEEKKEEKEDKPVTLKLSDEEAAKIISAVPYATPYSNEDPYSAFDSKKLEVKDMSANWMVYNAMTRVETKGECTTEQFELNGICDFTLKKEDVEKEFKKIYGDVKITFPDNVKDNFLWKCSLDNDVYACSNSGGGYVANNVSTYFNLFGSRNLIKFVKAEKDSKNLYVTVKYAGFEFVYDSNNDQLEPGDVTFRILKYGTGKDLVDETILQGTDFYEEGAKFADKVLAKYEDKLTTYKITYKIDGGNYVLVSTEPVK